MVMVAPDNAPTTSSSVSSSAAAVPVVGAARGWREPGSVDPMATLGALAGSGGAAPARAPRPAGERGSAGRAPPPDPGAGPDEGPRPTPPGRVVAGVEVVVV